MAIYISGENMIISEKQIQQLIHVAGEYRRELLTQVMRDCLTEAGKKELETICQLIGAILSQQSEELKVVE